MRRVVKRAAYQIQGKIKGKMVTREAYLFMKARWRTTQRV